MKDEIYINKRTMIRPATQEDINLVEANLRSGDLAECEILGTHDVWHQSIEDFQQCWAIFGHGKIAGYCGVMVSPGETMLSNKRWLCFLSTVAVDGMKKDFVRDSRTVLKTIVEKCQSHVLWFLSMPAAEYKGSVIWHERVLKMRKINTCVINDHLHNIYMINRKEVV